jgi:hypothetical protein
LTLIRRIHTLEVHWSDHWANSTTAGVMADY